LPSWHGTRPHTDQWHEANGGKEFELAARESATRVAPISFLNGLAPEAHYGRAARMASRGGSPSLYSGSLWATSLGRGWTLKSGFLFFDSKKDRSTQDPGTKKRNPGAFGAQGTWHYSVRSSGASWVPCTFFMVILLRRNSRHCATPASLNPGTVSAADRSEENLAKATMDFLRGCGGIERYRIHRWHSGCCDILCGDSGAHFGFRARRGHCWRNPIDGRNARTPTAGCAQACHRVGDERIVTDPGRCGRVVQSTA